MNFIEFYCLDNSQLANFEALNKGYRNDLVVEIRGDYFSIIVYDLTRLSQDVSSEFEEYGYYSVDNNLIIVKEVSFSEIKKTVEILAKGKYFKSTAPIVPDFSKLVKYG